MKKVWVGLITAAFLFNAGVAGVVGYAAGRYFNEDALKAKYTSEVDSIVQNEGPSEGAMQQYISERSQDLEKELDAYLQKTKSEWLANQGTLSPDEQKEIDRDYRQTLMDIKKAIDARWSHYGGLKKIPDTPPKG
jgi:hypothetical protein